MPDKQGFLACRGRAWAAEVSLPEVEGLTVTYSKSIIALGAVSIDIGEGQAVALLGANGAGKTTLLRAPSPG